MTWQRATVQMRPKFGGNSPGRRAGARRLGWGGVGWGGVGWGWDRCHTLPHAPWAGGATQE